PDEQRPSNTASLSRRSFAHIGYLQAHSQLPRTSGSASARKFVAHRSPSPAISLKEMRARRRATISKFLYIALGSACELKYLVVLSDEVGYSSSAASDIQRQCNAVVKQLERLTQKMEARAAAEKAGRRSTRSP